MKLKRTNNPAKLVCAFILHLLNVLLYWFIDRLFYDYASNEALINKIDDFTDLVYKKEWNLRYKAH